MANKINQIEIDSIIYDLQDKDAKAPFTGTKAEVQLAIAAGEIKEGDIVNITDDINDYPGGGDYPSGASNIVYLTQEQYDALPDDKLTDDIEYRITDEGTDTNADNVGYNNATSGLSAMNVQDAIDELSSRPGGGGGNVVYITQEAYDALSDDKLTNGIEYRIMDGDADETARNISYDNNESGLEAINVQQAIDKLAKNAGSGSTSNTMYLTQAEYDELPESKLTDGVEYFITDTGVMGAANNITYDNSNSGLEAINIQTAIDKVTENLEWNDVTNKFTFNSGYTPNFDFAKEINGVVYISLEIVFSGTTIVNTIIGSHSLNLSKNVSIPIFGYGSGYAFGSGYIRFLADGRISLLCYGSNATLTHAYANGVIL